MIDIQRVGETVSVVITGDISQVRFPFEFCCESVWCARLVSHEIKTSMGRLIAEARRDAYNHGYKDGRAKRAKRTWFSERL